MKKRGFLLVVLVLLFSQLVLADTLIEQGWFRNGDSFLANGKAFAVLLSETGEKVIISYDSDITTIDIGDCAVVANDVKVCLDDFEDHEDLRAELRIYSITPELKVTRSFNATTFFIGQKVKAEVSVENKGSRDAFGVVFIEQLPDGMKIIDSDADIINETITKWAGEIRQGDSKNISYEFIAIKELDAYDKASALLGNTTYYSKSQRLKADSCFGYKSAFNLTNVTVSSRLSFNITFDNKVNDDIDIEYVRAYLPESVSVEGDLEKAGSYWQWAGKIGGLRNRTIKSKLMPKEAFRLEFPVNVRVKCYDISYEKEFSELFDVKKPLLVFRTNLDDTNQTGYEFQKLELDSMQEQDFEIKVQKPEKELVFKNINITVKTNLEFEGGEKEFSYFIDKIDIIDNIEIFKTKLIAPLVAEKKVFYMNMTASYSTQYNQRFLQKKNYRLTVKPVENIRVTQDLSSTRAEESQKINITVSANNIREVDLKSVRFQDFLSYGNITEKLNERTIDIDKSQERVVYKYIIEAPKIKHKTTMTLETRVEYYEGNVRYSFAKSRSFVVEPKKLDLLAEPRIKGDSFTGTPLNTEYYVENKDTETAYNITLFFPLQQDLDVLGPENHTISKLSPGERQTLKDIGRLRAKNPGKLTINPFPVFYNDEDGNLFNFSSKSATKDIEKTLLIGPALLASKNASKSRLGLNELFKVDLVIENKGNEPADAVVYDGNKTWEFSLMPGRKKIISQNYIADVTGKYQIFAAKIRYSSLNETYTTVSNPVVVNVLVPKAEEEAKNPPVLVFFEQELKLNPLATLVLIVLVILTSVVAYIYLKEAKTYKKPLKYSEKEKKWIRL